MLFDLGFKMRKKLKVYRAAGEGGNSLCVGIRHGETDGRPERWNGGIGGRFILLSGPEGRMPSEPEKCGEAVKRFCGKRGWRGRGPGGRISGQNGECPSI